MKMASLAFDAVVTSMTLYKAFRIRRECGATSNPLIQTFLREGAAIEASCHQIDSSNFMSSRCILFRLNLYRKSGKSRSNIR